MSKFEALQKKLIKEAIILGVGIAVTGIIYMLLAFENSDLLTEKTKLKRESSSIQAQATTKENENELIAESYLLHKKLPQHKLPTSTGLSDTASRIRVARPIISDLKERFKFSKLNISFSKLVPLQDIKTKAVFIFHNEITIEFETLSDELVFSFCDAIIKEFPGYISVSSLQMSRKAEISSEILSKIQKREATLPALVDGRITLNWRTLKNMDTSSDPGKGV